MLTVTVGPLPKLDSKLRLVLQSWAFVFTLLPPRALRFSTVYTIGASDKKAFLISSDHYLI